MAWGKRAMVDPHDAVDHREPQATVGSFDRSRHLSQLRRQAGQPGAPVETFGANRVRRVLHGLHDLFVCEMNDAAQAVQPEMAVRGLHDSGDASERFVVESMKRPEAPFGRGTERRTRRRSRHPGGMTGWR